MFAASPVVTGHSGRKKEASHAEDNDVEPDRTGLCAA